MSQRSRRIVRRVVLALVVLIVLFTAAAGLGALWLRGAMKDSLPQVAGEVRLPGLSAPVTIERDALGTPTIHAASRIDASRALGFLHAQERFFQMDLMRRKAAGELSELFGPIAVRSDQASRIHRFRAEAEQIIAGLSPADRAMLDAYTGGVEAGRKALGGKPFEYAILRTEPAPWRSEDTLLAVFAMFGNLEKSEGYGESSRGLLQDLLPPELVAFLAPLGTEWDAPLTGEPIAAAPIPSPQVFDLRSPQWAPVRIAPARVALKNSAALPESPDSSQGAMVGSNNWAVAGSHTADGHALLANDMHLGLAIPNTWYRASLRMPDGAGGERRVTGVSLPGTPLVAAGSTDRIAWGFTNSYIDWHDVVLLETDAHDPEVYRAPDGPHRTQHFSEHIRVKGQPDEILDVPWTLWGPVTGKDHRGRPQVLSWIAHHPDVVNLESLRLETARTIDEAIDIAHLSGIPPQNFTVADADGRIGWTIIGRIPKRVGFDGLTPTSWADGSRRWDGWLSPAEVPRLVDPPSGRIWTANNRVVSGADLALLGDGGFDQGARARQIRDDLMALDKATPRDLLAIQLDDRALFLDRWRGVLLAALNDQALAGHPRRRELKQMVETTWTGHAAVGSAAYRAVNVFHFEMAGIALRPLFNHCKQADPRFNFFEIGQFEAPLWALVQQRPANLLDPRFKSWDEEILAAVDALLADYGPGISNLAARTWGERNTLHISHPLGDAIPLLGRWLNLPSHQLPGDQNMPRVQNPGFGASERLVVSPGHEETGFFHMPAGESGNPLSPHYGDDEMAWETGEPKPFLPGVAVSVLKLVP